MVGDRNEDGEAAVEHQGVLAEVGAAKNKNVWSCQLHYSFVSLSFHDASCLA